MKAMILALIIAAGAPQDSLRLMFWNVENFFDWRNDSTSVSEAEFSSRGARRWTRKRFYSKADAIAKSILWTAAQEGSLPDAIGLAEVENAFVLRRLLQETALRKLDYRIVHFDSPDPRGIDVALLYRSSRLELVSAKPCHLYAEDASVIPTRDILLAQFSRGGRLLSLLVNHHPSKFGGAAVSEPRRRQAVARLKALADSLVRAGPVVAMGDFNDTPDRPLYRQLAPTLRNLAEALQRKGEGSIKYRGKWELIDMFFVSDACGPAEMKILRIPFLLVPDKAFAGDKPFRTYSGPRYIGGVSDHCPIWLNLQTSYID